MRTKLMLVAVALSCLCGCLPEERIWWSPQGDRAIVLIDGRLHLTDADGRLGAPLTGAVTTDRSLVKAVSWLPDGSGFVCHRIRVIPAWEETRALIPAAEAEAVEKMAPAVLPLLDAAVILTKSAATLEAALGALPFAQGPRFGSALRRAFQQDSSAVENRLLALPQGREIVASLKKPESGFEVSELAVFKLNAKPEAEPLPIARSLLNPALLPRVSPRHDALAYLRLGEDGESATLEVLTLDGRTGFTVARRVAGAFDWMPDGRSLVFMAPIGGESGKLQSIHRIEVMQEDGVLLQSRGAEPPAEPVALATAITLHRPVLQALPDGRILFASQPITLPATGTGPDLEPRLYLVAANGKAVQPVPTAPGDLPTNLAFFAASPDGKRVAVVEAETDAVAVVEVDTGRTQIISPPHPRWHNRTMPAWKSATELTFAALHGVTNTPSWMLWSESAGTRCLSEKWPATATANWLEHKSAEAIQGTETAKPASTR